MENPANIDHLIRDKFESFAPAPPEHVWAGVQAGIAAQPTPGFFARNGRNIAVAAIILLLISLGIWMFMPGGDTADNDTDNFAEIENNSSQQNSGNALPIDDTEDSENLSDQSRTDSSDDQLSESSNLTDSQNPDQTAVTDNEDGADAYQGPSEEDIAIIEAVAFANSNTEETEAGNQESGSVERYSFTSLAALNADLENDQEASMIETNPEIIRLDVSPKAKPSFARWSHGVYFSPEFYLNDFDSIRLLPSYSLNYEPTYRFSNHWFMRFGAGLTYARERGFAKLDYIQNEVVGTYEDVYDVTFDSIGGQIIPTYHTKTTEVWDSVRHIQVKEITNSYLYLQTPVLFGYYNQTSKLNWYFYGGPSFNVMIGKWIEKPEEGIEDADIVNLENNLPNRSPFFMQLWVGAGIEYKIGKQLAIALEPNYRYYFNHVYDDPNFNTALSGFSLRFGLVFTVK